MVKVEDGDVIEINYVGRIKSSGEVFDLTDKETAEEENVDTENMELGPVKILLGEGYLLKGLEKRMKDMEVGEKETIEVPKKDAFGSRKSSNIKTISEREFKNYDVTPRRGMPVEVDGKRGKILTVSNGRVKVDFNHPLAGRDLEYDVEITRKIEDMEEKVEAVMDFYIDHEYEIEVDEGSIKVELEEEIPEELCDKLEEEVEKLNDVEKAEIVSGEEENGNGDSDEDEEKD